LSLNKIKKEGEDIQNEKTVDQWDLLYADLVDFQNKIIYDVRGPKHFLFNDESKHVANEVIKVKILENLGFKVKEIRASYYMSLT